MKSFNYIFIGLFVVWIGFFSIFTISEGQRGIALQFGKVKRDSKNNAIVYKPGIHFKVPFIDQIRKLDARIQTMDGSADRFVTSEKKDLIIDSYVKWKIQDFSKFYLSTGGSPLQAELLLQRKINNGLRSEIGARTITEIVSGERGEVMETALKKMARSSEIGINVIDVRIKQINLPAEVSSSIYQRMRAERTAVAKEHRSQGREQAEKIKATIDRKVTIMLANAEKEAKTIKGDGDAKAANIYAKAYGKNPEFFKFWRSLSAYKSSFHSGNDILVLDPSSDFFQYMQHQEQQ